MVDVLAYRLLRNDILGGAITQMSSHGLLGLRLQVDGLEGLRHFYCCTMAIVRLTGWIRKGDNYRLIDERNDRMTVNGKRCQEVLLMVRW